MTPPEVIDNADTYSIESGHGKRILRRRDDQASLRDATHRSSADMMAARWAGVCGWILRWAGCLQSCSWARGLLFLFQSLGYVISGSVCEEHIDDLSQFATCSSRIQLLHDAAQIGKKLRDGTVMLGLPLTCKSTFLANDKSMEKLIVGHLVAEGLPICQGTAATDLGIETAARKRRCASNQWKRIGKIRRRAKRVNHLCKMNPAAQKLRMTGIHSSCSSL